MQDNRDYIVANGEFRELTRQVAVLATKVDGIEGTLRQMGPFQCPVHTEQISSMRRDIGKLEEAQKDTSAILGKRGFISAVISACTAMIVLVVKYMVGK